MNFKKEIWFEAYNIASLLQHCKSMVMPFQLYIDIRVIPGGQELHRL